MTWYTALLVSHSCRDFFSFIFVIDHPHAKHYREWMRLKEERKNMNIIHSSVSTTMALSVRYFFSFFFLLFCSYANIEHCTHLVEIATANFDTHLQWKEHWIYRICNFHKDTAERQRVSMRERERKWMKVHKIAVFTLVQYWTNLLECDNRMPKAGDTLK